MRALTGVERFENLSVADGLSQNEVYAILQDRSGFLWFGTDNGLDRFDGYQFEHYRHRRDDTASLSESRAYSLLEDRKGNVWVGTVAGGLNRIDGVTKAVTRYDSAISDPLVSSLVEHPDGGIWAGTYGGLDLYVPATDSFRHFRHDDEVAASLVDDRIRTLFVDRSGRLWIGTESGLDELDRERNVFVHHRFADDPLVPMRNGAVKSIAETPEGNLWIGTRSGLYEYSPVRGPLRAFRHVEGDRSTIPFDDIWDIAVGPGGVLWLGTNGGGLIRLDPTTGRFEQFVHSRWDSASVGGDRIKALRFDRGGLLWIATLGGGVSVWNPRTAVFRSYRSAPGDDASRDDVFSAADGSNGIVWLGTANGLVRWNAANRSWAMIYRDREAPEVQAIARDGNGMLWVGTRRGVTLVRPDGSARRLVSLEPPRSVEEYSPGVVALLDDGQGHMWAGTESEGAFRIDLSSLSVRRYRHDPADPGSLSDDLVGSLAVDEAGALWLGTRNGVCRWRPESDSFERALYRDVERRESLHRGVVSIAKSGGLLWLGIDGEGLAAIASADSSVPVMRYTVDDGLLSNNVRAIRADGRGRLWISVPDGIVRFDPSTGEFETFAQTEGLTGLAFRVGSSATLDSGEIAFGGARGLVVFDPAGLEGHRVAPPPVVITGLNIGGRSTAVTQATGELAQVVLDHRHNYIAIDFAALDYALPAKNRYRYRLLGLTPSWVEAGTKREVTYTNLRPGSYVFEVLGCGPDGVWSRTQTRLPIIVEPPPWFSAPALFGYFILAIGLVGVLATSRARKQRDRLVAQRALRESEERLSLALWGSGTGMWDWNARSGRFYRSHTEEIIGIDADLIGATLDDQRAIVHPDDLVDVRSAWDAHLRGETPTYDWVFRLRSAEGRWVTVHERGRVVERDESGKPLRVNGTWRDITEQKNAQDELRLLATAFANTSEGMVITDTRGIIREVNDAFLRITGYTAAEVEGRHVGILNASPRSRMEEFFLRMEDHLREAGQWKGETQNRRRNGETFPAWVNVSVLKDDSGTITHFVGVFSDITERKRSEEDLRRLANYDVLTSLPNRTLFEDRLEHAIDSARRSGDRVSLMFIDLDRFKQINDSLGHGSGDRLLRAVAMRFRDSLRPSDTVARLGGDEFTVLLEDLRDFVTIIQVAERLKAALAGPFDIDGHEITVTPSIGISIFPDDAADGITLMRNADTAMYHAKGEGRNNYQFFTGEMNKRVVDRMVIENSLRRALKEGELLLHYQPRFDVSSGRITSVEALVRWESPDRGLLLPDRFIPVAEESGLVVELGEWVLREACRFAREWVGVAPHPVRVAVNLSARQFRQQNLAEVIRGTLTETGLDGSLLELEITETTIMSDLATTQEMLRLLKSMGLYVSVDDFGTGYSSLSYLKTFPLDALKIDQSFVQDVTADPHDAAIVSAIATMAKTLGLDVVGEGVESKDQLDFLAREGCDEVQGFLLSRPLPASEIIGLLERGTLDPPEHRGSPGGGRLEGDVSMSN